MAEHQNIEEIAKNAPNEKKEEPKKISSLESVVNESMDFGRAAFNVGLAATIPLTQANLVPYASRDTAVLTGAQIAADASTDIFKKGKKFTSGDMAKSAAVGTAISVPLYHLFDLVNKIPTDNLLGYAAKGAAWGGVAAPLYVPFYQFVDYGIKNMSFKGVGKYIKENFWPTYKTWLKYLFPINLINIFFVPPALQIPVSALTSYFFALFGAPKKGEIPEEKKRDKTPYLVAAPTVAAKFVRNSVKGLYDAAYAIGSGLRDLYQTSPKTSAPTNQRPAPANT